MTESILDTTDTTRSISITSAQYLAPEGINISIKSTINDEVMFVPLVEGNRHYDEIMRQVAAGELTIADAE